MKYRWSSVSRVRATTPQFDGGMAEARTAVFIPESARLQIIGVIAALPFSVAWFMGKVDKLIPVLLPDGGASGVTNPVGAVRVGVQI